jgi:hypothetical protein
MLELNFKNVMKGIQLQVNMVCLCPTHNETDRVYRNALEVLYHPSYSSKKNTTRVIDYGSQGGRPGIQIRFKCLTSYVNTNWRGFRGLFLLHPETNPNILTSQTQEELFLMNSYNERYMKQWQD